MGNHKSKHNNLSKLIFLDIDGVLNNANTDVTTLYVVEEDLAILLKRLIESVPKSAIVLSSTWRYKEITRNILINFFKQFNIPIYISCTKNLGTNRVDEILLWLCENTTFTVNGWENLKFTSYDSRFLEDLPEYEYTLENKLTHITHFIAIDDMDLCAEKSENISFIRDRFVHINKNFGITENDVNKSIKLLNDKSLMSN